MGSLILRGALKEFPDLRICFVEGSAAFVPWLMNRLDMDPNGRKKLGKDPSEFFSQIWVSAFAAETSIRYACDFWKDHNLTVGSDYPHQRSFRHLEGRHGPDGPRARRHLRRRQGKDPGRQRHAAVRHVAGNAERR